MGTLSIGFSAGLSGRNNFARKWDFMFEHGDFVNCNLCILWQLCPQCKFGLQVVVISLLLNHVASSVGNMGTLSTGFSADLSANKDFARKWISCLNTGILLTVICVYCGDYGHNVKFDCRLWLKHLC